MVTGTLARVEAEAVVYHLSHGIRPWYRPFPVPGTSRKVV